MREERESAVVFDVEGDRLVGVLAGGDGSRGVLVVVGGPQYRVGSHRQFVHLARAVSARNYPVLRFDYRGLGDSEGILRGFEHVSTDIGAAIDLLFAQAPTTREVVLWGLCDGASAALLYAPSDPRVSGIVMLNPWVRSEATQARATLRHYYRGRVLSVAFWKKAFSGEVDVRSSAASLAAVFRSAFRSPSGESEMAGAADAEISEKSTGPLGERMGDALAAFAGRVLVITSGRDLTAAEFRDMVRASPRWRRLLGRDTVVWHEIADANHTFSSNAWRCQVERETLDWMRSW